MTDGSGRADLVAAWAIGIGVGLIALQLTWLTANRVASVFWDAPAGPTIAFTTAVVVGIAVSVVAGRRLARKTTEANRA